MADPLHAGVVSDRLRLLEIQMRSCYSQMFEQLQAYYMSWNDTLAENDLIRSWVKKRVFGGTPSEEEREAVILALTRKLAEQLNGGPL